MHEPSFASVNEGLLQGPQKSSRYSRQRETVLQVVLEDGGHLTADEIYKRVSKKLPKVSLATVYRNLRLLEEGKMLSQMQGADQVTHFEPYAEPHHHFICKACKKIWNLDSPTVQTCTGCISPKVPFTVDAILTTLYGECENCRPTLVRMEG